jgi:hypothetical protein
MILAAKHQPENKARSGNRDGGRGCPEYEIGGRWFHVPEIIT